MEGEIVNMIEDELKSVYRVMRLCLGGNQGLVFRDPARAIRFHQGNPGSHIEEVVVDDLLNVISEPVTVYTRVPRDESKWRWEETFLSMQEAQAFREAHQARYNGYYEYRIQVGSTEIDQQQKDESGGPDTCESQKGNQRLKRRSQFKRRRMGTSRRRKRGKS
jgi:hypothetical protein